MNIKGHPIEPEELMEYLDGELPPGTAARAAEHLGTCRECQALASDLRRMSERMMEWQVETPELKAPRPESAAAKAEQPRRRWYLWKTVWVAAAVITLVIGVVAPRRSLKRVTRPAADLQQFAYLQSAPSQQVGNRSIRPGAPPGARLEEFVSVEPLIARSARLSLVAKDFAQAADSVQSILKRHRGYAAEMTINAEAATARTLDASLRTPQAELDSTLADLKALGRVISESRAGEDVTRQSADLDARLANAKNREQVLTELMKHRAARLSDVLEVEEQISTTRGEIEQMQAERKNLDKRIDYARIDLQITEVYQAQLDSNRTSAIVRLRNSAVAGAGNVGDSVVNVAAFLLSDGPVVLLWCAVLVIPAWSFWRWRRTKNRN